jgi:hypothetical protein
MSLTNFIPVVWASSLLSALRSAHVYGSPMVINTDYEGDIRNLGDSVKINSIGDPTIKSYTRNSDMDAAETLADAGQMLLVDQAKYFNFAVDDVDRVQQTPKVMNEAMTRAAYGLRNTMDEYLASLVTGAGLTSGLGNDTTALVPSIATVGTTVYDYLVDMGTLLNEQDCPATDRWVILPPWMHGLLLKDARFVGYGTEANRSTAAEGNVGRAAGFEILVSNNVPDTSGAKYKVLAGHRIAWTMAEQIIQLEAYRPERRFSDAVKGLHVYGAKILRANCLALGTFSKT